MCPKTRVCHTLLPHQHRNFEKFRDYKRYYEPWGANPGGRVPPPPHVFSGGGHNIKCPPPHVLGVGWILVDIMYFFAWFFSFCGFFVFCFLFFVACQKCSWCGLGTPTHFDLRDFRRRWRSGKKSVGAPQPPPPPPSPPPAHHWAFLGLALPLGLAAVGKNVSFPPQSASDLRPCYELLSKLGTPHFKLTCFF